MAKHTKESIQNILLGVKGSRDEPEIDINDYNHTMSRALNFYNIFFSLSDYKASALEYASTLGIKLSGNIPEYSYRGIGAVARLIMRNCTVRVDDIDRTISKLHQIQADYEKTKVVDIVKLDIVPVIKELDFYVIDFLNDIEDNLIQSILDGKKLTSDSYISEFTTKEYSKTQAKEVSKFVQGKLEYYNSVYIDRKGSDADVKDAWIHIPSTRIKTAINTLESLLNGINTIQVKAKVSKIVAKKELSPMLQTKDVPFLKEYENIKGIHPKDCIGHSELWVFDIETRDLIVLRSVKDTKFSAKGHAFLNVDDTRSIRKKLRKVEDLQLFTNTLETINKKFMATTFDTIKTKPQGTSGRLNSSKIIINAFK